MEVATALYLTLGSVQFANCRTQTAIANRLRLILTAVYPIYTVGIPMNLLHEIVL